MNTPIFSESEVMLYRPAVERHNFDYTGVADGEEIADGVRVVATPGHTLDHASLLVVTAPLRYSERTQAGGSICGIGEVRIAVAGDAIIDAAYYALGRAWDYNRDFYSHEAAKASMDLLSSQADFIIPGHGTIFRSVDRIV